MRTTGRSYDKVGAAHPKWSGGRSYNGQGYVRVWVPPEDRPRFAGRGYALEHRLVMEQMLGRPLKPYEQVHHKNGVRDDNRPENLELWNRSHPDGLRASDLPHCPTCSCGR